MDNFHVISGSSGGGKSTLVEALADRGYVVVREAGRQLVREQQEIGDMVPPGTELFGHLLLSRSMDLYNRAKQSEGPVFFDRSVMEPVSWLHSSGQYPDHLDKIVSRYRYATTVFMVPPWPEIYTKDAERQRDYDPEQSEYLRLMETFAHYGYRTLEIPKLTVPERTDFVEATLNLSA